MDNLSHAPSSLLQLNQSGIETLHADEVKETPTMTRRRFGQALIHMGAALLCTGAGAATVIGSKLSEQAKVRKSVEGEFDDFKYIYADALKQTELSASFSPAHFYHFNDVTIWKEFKDTNSSSYTPLEALEVVNKVLGFTTIRLGFPLPDLQLDKNNKIIIHKKHRDLIEYSIDNNIKLILNVPPRVFAWPEDEHNRELEIRLGAHNNLPVSESTIGLNDEYGKIYLEIQNLLLQSLLEEYSELNKLITAVQPPNEFNNPLGMNRWTLSQEYMIESIKQITQILPDKHILINSAVVSTEWHKPRPQIEEVKSLIENYLYSIDPKTKFLLGLDYYNDIPESPLLPWFSGSDRIDNFSLLELTSVDGSNVFKALEVWGANHNVDIVASEIQLRPGANKTISIDQAEFTFARTINALVPHTAHRYGLMIPQITKDKKLSIGIWGVELLAKKILCYQREKNRSRINEILTTDTAKIINLLQYINKIDATEFL